MKPERCANELPIEDTGEYSDMHTSHLREACIARATKRLSLAHCSDESFEGDLNIIEEGRKIKVQIDLLDGIPTFSDAPVYDACVFS